MIQVDAGLINVLDQRTCTMSCRFYLMCANCAPQARVCSQITTILHDVYYGRHRTGFLHFSASLLYAKSSRCSGIYNS